MPIAPIIPNTITLAGDVRGDSTSTEVVSIENVETGVLSLDNGGTGLILSDYSDGALLQFVGGQITQLTGLEEGDVIYWDVTSGQWAIKPDPTLAVPQSFYDIFSGTLTRKSFLSTPVDDDGELSLREITNEDLPDTFDGKELINARVEAELTGSLVSDNAIIDYAEIADGSFTGIFSGDGSEITGISAANIQDLADFLQSPDNIQIIAGSNVVIEDNIVSVADDIEINSIAVDEITTNNITANSFTGAGNGLTDIPNSALQNSTFTINGQEYSLGDDIEIEQQGFIINGTEYPPGSDITITELANDIEVDSVTANQFNGSGAGLTDIPNEALVNSTFTINGTEYALGSDITINEISEDLEVSTVTANQFNGSGVGLTDIPNEALVNSTFTINGTEYELGSDITIAEVGSDIVANTVTADQFTGAGTGLTDIPNEALVNSTFTINGTEYELGSDITIAEIGTDLVVNTVTADEFIGSGVSLTDIPITALQYNSIFINGTEYFLGDELVSTDFVNYAPGTNILIDKEISSSTVTISVDPDPIFDSVRASTISGSGAEIFNISEDAINGISITQANSFSASNIISYDGSNYITSSYNDNREICGIVTICNSSSFSMKTNGNVTIDGTSSYPIGTKIFAGVSGGVALFTDIPSGKYAKCVGIKVSSTKINLIKDKITRIWK